MVAPVAAGLMASRRADLQFAGEDIVEHAQPAPADEPVVYRHGWSVFRRGIAPQQAVPNHEDDPAGDTAIINPGHSMR